MQSAISFPHDQQPPPARAAPQALRHLRQHQLRLLELVHEHGSLSAAALALHLTQPALTRMLHDLEAAIGCQLVARDSKGARLTAAGQLMMRRVRLSLAWVEEAWQELQAQPPRPRLRVGYMPFVGAQVLPLALVRLGTLTPPPRFQVAESTLVQMLDGLLTGRLDAIIATLDTTEVAQITSERLTLVPLYQERLSIACSPALHPHLPRRTRLVDLATRRWVVAPHGTRTRQAFDAAFLAAGVLPPEPEIESGAYHANLSMVGHGDALFTICPRSALLQYGPQSDAREVALAQPFPRTTVNLLAQAHAATLPEMQALADALRSAARTTAAARAAR